MIPWDPDHDYNDDPVYTDLQSGWIFWLIPAITAMSVVSYLAWWWLQ